MEGVRNGCDSTKIEKIFDILNESNIFLVLMT